MAAERVLVTPTAFNSRLWRVDGDHFHEGFHSLLDAEPCTASDRFERGDTLARDVQRIDGVQCIAAFSKGLHKLQQEGPGSASATCARARSLPTPSPLR
jgi:inner membrane protein